jgi:type 1 glutamine amidotransferase
MTRSRRFFAILSVPVMAFASFGIARGAEQQDRSANAKHVYGEWRIRVKPDKGEEYNTLIQQRGLPLFREAGGRMVGWWKTLAGNLYEQTTIWEYDDMSAYERAVERLGHDQRFAEFAARRDPLLAGEESRFLKLADGAERPDLPDNSKFVIHEIHRVAQSKLAQYLRFMTTRGLSILKSHGFRPVGPWTAEIGPWSQITYLFRFNSLAERSRLIEKFSGEPDAKIYGEGIAASVDDVTTRLLFPAPFAKAPQAKTADRRVLSPLLPHLEQLAEGVFAAGFADRFGSANCGWVRLAESTLLIDVPHGVDVPAYLAEVERLSGRPARRLALTNLRTDDRETLEALCSHGIAEIVTSPVIRDRLLALKGVQPMPLTAISQKTVIGDKSVDVQFVPLDAFSVMGGAAIHVPDRKLLFAGPLVVNGPRTPLDGSDTEIWVSMLEELEALRPDHVVPAHGSWGGPQIVTREKRFLNEIRQQVAYVVAQGRPESALMTEVRIPAIDLVWMPYDTPTQADLEYVYHELTVPIAPFHGHPHEAADGRPHALVLLGDQPHEPAHLVKGLKPAFEATGVIPHFAVDVRALSAENLAKVQLLVMLRDGLQRPTSLPTSNFMWITPEQQAAIVQFVMAGGAFLNLHNSMGLYPENGDYLKLVGGRYIGHGPLERFRVEVVDANHPITRGVEDFWVADEQHTPPYDSNKVHLLLRNRSDDGKVTSAAGWAYEPGKGRLCHLANGHTLESLQHPMYQRLLHNAIDWLLRRDSK